MDKKTSVSTVILVLLVLLTLVSLSASAYLYFTFNPLNTNTDPKEEIVEEDEYEGWKTYTNEDPFLTLKYPTTWMLETAEDNILEKYAYNLLKVSKVPNEGDIYDYYVAISEVEKNLPTNFNLSEYLTENIDFNEDGDGTDPLYIDLCDLELIEKWGVQTYKCVTNVDEGGSGISYYIVVGDSLLDIYHRNSDSYEGNIEYENVEKVLNSIEFR